MMTRRGAGTVASGAAAAGVSWMGAAGSAIGAAGDGGAAAAGGCATTGALATTGPAGGAAAMAGRSVAATAGGLATTGPAGGRAAMAGVCGGAATMGAAARGWGTILRGAGFGASDAACGAIVAAEIAGRAADGAVATAGFTGAAGAGVVARGAGADSCSFFWRMAFRTSPGLETFERSILGFGAASTREDPTAPDLPRWS
jgi:hypothetical protein